MTCGIYKLSFDKTDKVYIGKSINIEERFKQHLTTFKTGKLSNKLLEARDLYGLPNLTILIECDVDKLNESEIACISEYNAFNNGFNSTIGGDGGYSDSTNAANKYDKEDYINVLYMLTDIKKSLIDIAIESKVHHKVVRHIFKKEAHTWLERELPEVYKAATSLDRDPTKRAGKHAGTILVDEFGDEWDAGDYMDLCKIFDLDPSGISMVLNGSRNHHKGFRLKEPIAKKIFERPSADKVKAPDGTLYDIPWGSKAAFCREHELRAESLTRLIRGETKQYKGWTLPD